MVLAEPQLLLERVVSALVGLRSPGLGQGLQLLAIDAEFNALACKHEKAEHQCITLFFLLKTTLHLPHGKPPVGIASLQEGPVCYSCGC